jgi:phospholipase A1/A2
LTSRYWIFLSILMLPSIASADEGWLIATQNEYLSNNGEITVEVVKPLDETSWPEPLILLLKSDLLDEKVKLTPTTFKANDIRRIYRGIITSKFNGTVRAELINIPSNRLLMAATADEPNKIIATKKQSEVAKPSKDQVDDTSNDIVVIPEPKEDRTITANEPLYFIVGSNKQRNFDARFQISFKYRPFDPDSTVATFIPYASNLYFAYTQTSIWDLGSESSPFKDTSYRPSLYYNWDEKGNGYNPDSWKFGLEHESNGRDGDESRSLNIAFIQPTWNIEYSGGKTFTFMPRFYQYIEKTDNRDLHHYRGYVDWLARYGRNDAAILTAMYRQGTEGYAQGQLDLSYPISDKLFGRTGTFLHLQLLGGYGETLIDYNKRSDTQLRIGISLAR